MKNFLIDYILHLADNALILGHRNSEWCGHGPVLEQDIAITNISLDLIGQARNFYQYAAKLMTDSKAPSPWERGFGGEAGGETTEDSLAYLRNPEDFKNCLLLELPRGDWAFTILRQFYFSNYQFFLFTALLKSKDEQIAAIAEKSIKEVTYHLRWSSEWVIRLGDGTNESFKRMQNAIDDLSGYTDEFFIPADYEIKMAKEGIGVDPVTLRAAWQQKVNAVFSAANLPVINNGNQMNGGKSGKHGDNLNSILKDMQELQRTYPGAEW
ncbi:MAG TPA: 1,2-phenylacetyl-CoA epoxidase subunit PaaC [Chitinophagaceae bacterium]|nr:1,2-phenylacetyl-CoA epoxidase subunit PaaC [Chitinophagaceae bacterium]